MMRKEHVVDHVMKLTSISIIDNLSIDLHVIQREKKDWSSFIVFLYVMYQK